uniref:GNAT family N-acetyltransferase n=1 Tax=Altererythrobacter segetis TaxID=1104773 RepID=UPI001FB042AF|nr:GNAT family protein [Altererythrobacter segetis]
MTGQPFLTTERLELWQPRASDLKAMHAIVLQPSTRRFLGTSAPLHEHATRFTRGAGSWFLYGYGPLMLRLRGSETLIGNCGVFHTFRGLGDDFDDHPEAGWIVAADHVGQGLASEAMRTVLDWFDREHGARRIVCMISVGNEPSLKLAAKLGFTPLRQTELPDGDVVQLLERLPA